MTGMYVPYIITISSNKKRVAHLSNPFNFVQRTGQMSNFWVGDFEKISEIK
jgi:hypothetical protein